MSELKTLKDMRIERKIIQARTRVSIYLDYVNYQELKAEAIKWVKHCEEDEIKKMDAMGERYNWKQAFKNFNNITEEDLKDE